MLDRLERSDRHPELHPLANVLDRQIEHSLRRTEGIRRDEDRRPGRERVHLLGTDAVEAFAWILAERDVAHGAGSVDQQARSHLRRLCIVELERLPVPGHEQIRAGSAEHERTFAVGRRRIGGKTARARERRGRLAERERLDPGTGGVALAQPEGDRGEQRRVNGVGGNRAPPKLLGEDRELQQATALTARVVRSADASPALADSQGERVVVVDPISEHPIAYTCKRRLAFDRSSYGLAQELLLIGEEEIHVSSKPLVRDRRLPPQRESKPPTGRCGGEACRSSLLRMQTSTNGRTNGRVALVTGGARGIGEAIARSLADDGFAVAVADLRLADAEATATAIRDAGSKAVGIECDVTSTESVNAGLAAAGEAFGPIDVVVNNAGWDDLKPFVNTDEEFWDRVLEVNFKGALRVTHGALPGMLEREWGRIINIGSDAGRVGSSLESVYSGAKGGIIAFTKTIAREVARKGVTANAVCPGPTDTPFLREVVAKQGDADKVIGAMVSGVPMKRLAAPQEIAAAVRFFAREDAGYVTGQTLSVSGGLTMA